MAIGGASVILVAFLFFRRRVKNSPTGSKRSR